MEELNTNNVHLIKGDCLEIMRNIKDNSIDLVIIDPPYKLTGGGCKYKEGDSKILFNKISLEKQKNGVLFETPKFKDYFKDIYRILKDGSHFYCMCNDKHLKDVIIEAEKVGFKEVNILVWAKGMHTPLPYYMKNIEFIVLFRKGKARKINNMGSFALINIKGIRGNKVHPSEKPAELMEHLILNSSNEGDTVLDCFMGSGSCGIAVKHNRKFIGIELDNEYFDIAYNRINGYIYE